MDLGVATGFVVVFLVIGGLEFFDRTAFALIALASRAHAFASWAGAAVAFVVTTALSVSVGAALVDAIGPSRLGLIRVAGGVFLLGYAGWVYFHPGLEESPHLREDVRSALTTAFLTIFLLEMGDVTMIFEIVFVTDWGWFTVLIGGAAALVTIAAWNVHLGRVIGARVAPRLLNRIVVLVLSVVGVFTIAYGLVPAAFPTLGLATAL